MKIPSSPDSSEIGDRPRPRVIFDVLFEDGILSFVIANIGDSSAIDVSTTLDKKILGLAGTREVNELSILKEIAFMPPNKKLTFLLDSSSSYFARKQPTQFTATIKYSDGAGESYTEKITHDLEIYRDLPYRVDEGKLLPRSS